MVDSFWQNALWEKLDDDHDHNIFDDHTSMISQAQSVPEPSGIVGILGITLLGMRSFFKGKNRLVNFLRSLNFSFELNTIWRIFS